MRNKKSLWVSLGTIIPSVLCFILFARTAQRSLSETTSPTTTSGTLLPGETSTLLPDGEILLLGGQGKEGPVATAELENPLTGTIISPPKPMLRARAWHTATVLPDGDVLVFGGVGSDGQVVNTAELFDPSTKQFTDTPSLGVTPRSHATATLLTDGTVFFAGGLNDDSQTLGSAQLWDPRTNTTADVPHWLFTPRSDQTAKLQADGTVLLWGGKDATGLAVNSGEVYDPETKSFMFLPTVPAAKSDPIQTMATIPEDTSRDVPSNIQIAIRFSLPVQVQSVTEKTITLSGPNGIVAAKVVPTDSGMLAFVTPKVNLTPATDYTVELNGLKAATGQGIPQFSFDFTTADNGVGLPNTVNWSGGPKNSPYLKLPPLHAAPGATAIAGQVLLQNGLPVKKVTLRVGTDSTKTDGTGRFLLQNVMSGHDVLVIDGRTASTKKVTYGVFEVGTDVTAGETNTLNYTVWMPVIDTAHAVTIPVPTTQETVVTSPLIPGLELHLPAGTTITDIDGKVVNQVSITPIPVSQPPFPLPKGVEVPTYFTIQPGGGWIWVNNSSGPKGGWLVYPNAEHEPAGTRFNFWNYNAKKQGWYVYGQGSVSADGQSVVPDPGVVIYALTGAMVANPSLAPGIGPSDSGDKGGEPVDLGTGLFVYRKVDLFEPDVIPIVLTRTYRELDSSMRDFGIGTQNPYDMYLVGNYGPWTYANLVFADGSEVYYTRISSGTSYNDAVFQAQTSGGPFFESTIKWNGSGWTLTRKDGTTYRFPGVTAPTTYQQDGLLSITDRNGNTLTITRDSNYNITKITSPNGRWIQFSYDPKNRITQAQDELGRTVLYKYDANGRLTQVTDANNGVWKYAYDSNNNMTSIIDPRNITYLTNQYDSSNRVIKQTLADSGTYIFNYVTDGSGNITETDMTDPDGNVRKVTFNTPPTNPSGFVTGSTSSSITYANGTPQAATYTYSYQAGTDLLTSVTDPLSRVTSYTYDNLGNTTSITRLAGTSNAVTTRFSYDPTYSQLTSVTTPLGYTTTFTLDSKGNVTSITRPAGNFSQFSYDSEGRIRTATDQANDVTTFSYTAADLTSVADPLNRTTAFSYDSAGRMLSMTSPMNHVTKYAYNPLNQITSITDALGGITSFTYDGDGNLLSVTDPQNSQNPTIYTYNSMNEIGSRKDPLGNTESFQYDGNGNLTQLTDRRGKVTTYDYDPLNRLTFIGFGTQAGPTYTSTINYTYDGGNRLTQAVDSTSGTFTRSYDGLDRLTQEQGPEGTVGYAYDADGRRMQMTVSNQADAVTYAYDNDGRVTNIHQGTSNVSLAYDAENRRTSMTLPNGIVASYSYDSASELTGIDYNLAGTPVGTLTYSYDGDGRRSQMGGTLAQISIPNATTGNAVYNVANQLTQWNGVNLTYDANGNLTGDGLNNYTWNARNTLSTVKDASTGTTLASFIYGPFGRRIQNAGGDGVLYDGLNAVQELSGATPMVNRLTGGLDEFFARTDSAGTTFPLADALGSTIALTDSTGTVQTQYTYDPFGGTTASGATNSNTYQFTGRVNDGTGLYYYRARYYSSRFQRFISEDPLGFSTGFNVYRYVSDDPVNRVDPSGMWQITLQGGWGWGGRVTFGNNGGSGLFNGQWNFGAYVGAGEGFSVGVDIYNRGCRERGTNFGVESGGQVGLGAYVDAETHEGYNSWVNVNFKVPGTPLGASIGSEGVTVPTFAVGESLGVGVGGTHYF